MSLDDRLQRFLSRWGQRLPADSAAVIGLTLLAGLFTLLPGAGKTPFRALLVLPLVLFLPGYAFISILFPEQENSSEGMTSDESTKGRGILSGRSINSLERVLLSVGNERGAGSPARPRPERHSLVYKRSDGHTYGERIHGTRRHRRSFASTETPGREAVQGTLPAMAIPESLVGA